MSKIKVANPVVDFYSEKITLAIGVHNSSVEHGKNYEYTEKFLETVDQQVYLAKLRIAYILNRLVHEDPSTEPLDILRRAIVSIVGDFTEFVSLKPRPPTAKP